MERERDREDAGTLEREKERERERERGRGDAGPLLLTTQIFQRFSFKPRVDENVAKSASIATARIVRLL